MNRPLRSLGVPPNAWAVNAEIADITRPRLEPRLTTLPTETKTLRLDLAKAAILVIDMQTTSVIQMAGWRILAWTSHSRTPISPENLAPALRGRCTCSLGEWGNRPDLLNISASLLHVYNPLVVWDWRSLPANDALVLISAVGQLRWWRN